MPPPRAILCSTLRADPRRIPQVAIGIRKAIKFLPGAIPVVFRKRCAIQTRHVLICAVNSREFAGNCVDQPAGRASSPVPLVRAYNSTGVAAAGVYVIELERLADERDFARPTAPKNRGARAGPELRWRVAQRLCRPRGTTRRPMAAKLALHGRRLTSVVDIRSLADLSTLVRRGLTAANRSLFIPLDLLRFVSRHHAEVLHDLGVRPQSGRGFRNDPARHRGHRRPVSRARCVLSRCGGAYRNRPGGFSLLSVPSKATLDTVGGASEPQIARSPATHGAEIAPPIC